jgi:hypothetical protein
MSRRTFSGSFAPHYRPTGFRKATDLFGACTTSSQSRGSGNPLHIRSEDGTTIGYRMIKPSVDA